MAKSYLIVLFASLLVVLSQHASARNIPNENKPSTTALAPITNTNNVVHTTANSPTNGVDDEKNFITYGGVGGWAGVGGFAGVIPVLGGVGGVGGGAGLGGLGGGAGGLGGLGGGSGGLGGIGVPGVGIGVPGVGIKP